MKKVLVAAVAATFVISGCASSGNASIKDETSETISQKLSEGMTMAEVKQNLGDPLSTSYTDGGNAIWNYAFSKSQMTAESFIPYWGLLKSGSKGTAKQLVILFDEEDKVKKFNLSDSQIETNTGLIQ